VQFNGAQDIAQINIAEDAEDIDTDPVLAGKYLFDTLFHEQALVWDHNASEKLSFKSLLSHTYSNERGEFGGVGDYEVDEDAVLLKTKASYALSDQHDLIVGAQVTRGDVDLDITAGLPDCGELDADCLLTGEEQVSLTEKFKFTTTQAYIKDNWYVTDKFTLYPGVAFQSEDIRNNQFIEPRLAAEYALSEKTIVSAGVGQYQQSPGYLESSKEFGNPNLEYSDALHAQLGLQRFFNSGWSAKSELYYKSLDNLSTSDPLLNYSNDGQGHAYGLDTLIRKDLTDKFSGWASVSLSQARRKDKRTGETFVFDYDQPVNVSFVGNYKFNKKWTVGAKLWAHSGAPVTPVTGAVEDVDRPGFYRPIYGKLNSDRFPTYHRVDVRIDRTFQRKNDNTMGAYFELFNILGTKNALDRFFLVWIQGNVLIMEFLKQYLDISVFAVLGIMSFLAVAYAIERAISYSRIKVKQYPQLELLKIDLNKGLPVIATIASNAPYVGLLGRHWPKRTNRHEFCDGWTSAGIESNCAWLSGGNTINDFL